MVVEKVEGTSAPSGEGAASGDEGSRNLQSAVHISGEGGPTPIHQRQSIRIEDAAIVVTDAGGRIRIHQTRDAGTAQGAMAGTWLGALEGLIFLAPLVVAVLGAAIGGIWARLRDIGISDREMREMGEHLDPGTAALFLLFEPLAPTTLVREMHGFNGKVLRSTLDDDLTAEISAALAEVV